MLFRTTYILNTFKIIIPAEEVELHGFLTCSALGFLHYKITILQYVDWAAIKQNKNMRRIKDLFEILNMWKKTKSGGEGHRSPYLSHAKRALYHLSYTPGLFIFSNRITWEICLLSESLLFIFTDSIKKIDNKNYNR